MTAVMTVDQSLVDSFLERVNRFVDNVDRFEETIKEELQSRFSPTVPEPMVSVPQAAAATDPEQSVITPDDIDLNALLQGVDFDGGMYV